ncbi:MAG TPA: LysR family transcriptional regulator [Caulobacteraceae bacterium]|jgi:DNA-binding transcriptional LysR family regulator
MDRLAVMETLVRIADTGSFSAAARHLNIGQPAVSKCIAKLEDRLGVSLLLRSTRGLTLTEAGRRFCERARRAIEEADAADLAARDSNTGLYGRLRVAAGVTFGNLYLVPLLQAFLTTHPNLSIDLVLDDRTIDPVEEGIDVGLHFGPLPDSLLRARKIATGRRLVLGSTTYFERSGVPITPTDLTSHAAVIYTQDPGGTDTWRFRRADTEISVSLSGQLSVSASEGLRAAVLGGIGLAITSRWMFDLELTNGSVRAVLTDWALPTSDLWAVFPTARKSNVKAHAFAAFVEAELLRRRLDTGLQELGRREGAAILAAV